MRLRMLTTALLALVLATSVSAATTIPLGGDAPRLTLQADKSDGLTYRVEVGEMQALTVDTKGGVFTQLFIPGFHSSMVDGAPELPQMNRLIAVPAGAAASVSVTNVVTRTVRLADYGLDNPLFPHQPSLSKSQRPEDVPFHYDADAYAQAKVQNELVEVEYLGRMRATDLARLEIAPVRYLPASGELEVVVSCDVEVSYDRGWAETERLQAATASPFYATAYAEIDGVHRSGIKNDLVQEPVTMVVITPPEFEAQLADYVQWKTERGFNVIVGVTGTPEVGSTTSTIHAYLEGLYLAGTPENPAPSFVVFVGDIAQVPTWNHSGDTTDRPYCEMTGDLYPEMYYGRLSATNSSMLQAILDKTLLYDTYSMPDPTYLQNVTLIAGMDGSYGATHGNGTIRYGEDYYYNAAHDINAYMYYYPESGSNAANIIANCSDGIGFINYTAHGSTTSWSNPSMTQSDVNGMTNDGKYFLAVGNCCLTGSYQQGECFGETFLRAPNKGAVGYIGGSDSTYWDEDVWWAVGSIPSGSIRDGMTYEETGSGVYDAAFHDLPNEVNDPTLWYVTNGAVVFRGNLAVSEAGSSRETYYWNIYNLLGDPSISTYMGQPPVNEMTYPETVFVGVPSMTVTGEWGTYIGCTQDGVLVGTGLVDETGTGTVEFNQILTPGVPLKMVAMISTHEPVIVDLNVIVPADVSIDPAIIDANVATDITVTVMEEDGVTPKPGINVWAEGLEYTTTPVMTDAGGVAVINVNYPYGPTLDIVGQDPADTYRLFTETVEVNALALNAPNLSVATDIGMVDMFPLNLPGTLNARVGQAGYTLFAQMPDGTLESVVGSALTVTAGELGQVTGMIVLSGYDIYTEAFDVVEAYGTVAGNVTSEGTAMPGVTVNLLDDQQNVVFSVITDASGDYAGPEEVLVDDYTIVVDHFGYLHYEQSVFVNYGANTFDIALDPAPAGVLWGHVYDSVTMEPLQATVRIYRPDTGELYNEVVCDENGMYTTGSLPYFTYEVKVRAWHHVPVTASVIINLPSLEKDWVLDPTNGDLLLIDDSAKTVAPDKYSEKGEFLAQGYQPDSAKSVAELTADLEELGYYVSVEAISAVDPATFWDYDLVILACGDNTSGVSNDTVRDALAAFAADGGHILLEGGEVGYNEDDSGAFATNVMHSTSWGGDSVGSISVPSTSHYVATYPNNLADTTINLTYSGYGDSDGMVPLADAELVAGWTQGSTDEAAVIAFDTNPSPIGGQIVFFCFNYAAAGAERVDLLENAVLWLLTPEVGNSAVSGTVTLQGQSDHSGITVRALPGGPNMVTGADGTYQLDGLFAGPYTIVAEKEGWSVGAASVELTDGQHLTGVDLTLTPVTVSEFCDQPGAAINDNQTTTVTMDVPVALDLVISELEVFIDISHTYQGDLHVTVTSPCGASVILHGGTGGSADNIYGWYPTELTPAESLDAFIGLHMAGEWTLTVYDDAGGDQGTINEWCLRFTHGIGDITGVDDPAVPVAFRSYQNFPNPFNPMTTIKFDLPREGQVSLRVYDLAGRMVRELVNETLPAATHTAVWDGSDSAGRRMASGVYYYRVVTDNEVATHKMTLVK